MGIDEHQAASGDEKVRGDLHPPAEGTDPTKNAIRSINKVETSFEVLRKAVDIGFDEAGLDTEVFGETASLCDGFVREVDGRDVRALRARESEPVPT